MWPSMIFIFSVPVLSNNASSTKQPSTLHPKIKDYVSRLDGRGLFKMKKEDLKRELQLVKTVEEPIVMEPVKNFFGGSISPERWHLTVKIRDAECYSAHTSSTFSVFLAALDAENRFLSAYELDSSQAKYDGNSTTYIFTKFGNMLLIRSASFGESVPLRPILCSSGCGVFLLPYIVRKKLVRLSAAMEWVL
ncbi:hypothetical protein Y032_0004g2037 [Ancylostoma ceylanicum]|uniref:Uncharacterized protein n=1 Tax=Ancylostoma ceylanicum TaxID=53326 RepID=A0A016VUG3_9BILA|nr:hypothetical protein Y032_0004g2037 [Ancylostoma ceylanicum]